ncbi:MAG: beta-galactosidase, partial [Niabella sp.]
MQVFKVLLIGCCFCVTKSMLAQPQYVKITKPESAKGNVVFNMGTATNPKGSSIIVTPQSLLFNGKPVVPVMGEIHFSRIAENEWEKELLKMKAGGITIIATYVFWIHHEEIEAKYNWDGQRNLTKFLEICKQLDLPVVLRIGPWAHGECRNGGFPEWLVTSGVKLRNDNVEYLAIVKSWYQQIFNQAKCLLW